MAHRGGQRGVKKENTLSAFLLSVAEDFGNIEMDIRLNHWNGTFYLEHDLVHRRRVRKNFFSKVIAILPTDTTLFCELKTYTLTRTLYARYFWQAMKQYSLEKRVVLMSFNPFILSQLRRIGYTGRTGMLVGSRLVFQLVKNFIIRRVKPDFLMVSKFIISPKIMEFARKNHFQVFIHVANTEKDWKKGLDFGVDGMITDYPQALRQYLEAKNISCNY